jgi:hypothetical protein
MIIPHTPISATRFSTDLTQFTNPCNFGSRISIYSKFFEWPCYILSRNLCRLAICPTTRKLPGRKGAYQFASTWVTHYTAVTSLRRSATWCDDGEEERQRCKLFLLKRWWRRRCNCRRWSDEGWLWSRILSPERPVDFSLWGMGRWASQHNTRAHTANRSNPSNWKRNLGTPSRSRFC